VRNAATNFGQDQRKQEILSPLFFSPISLKATRALPDAIPIIEVYFVIGWQYTAGEEL